ncbi:MAG: ABC transporter substrate-binding protein [Chloroflexota bacterium]|nr:ABC transporter substrate-binding protein [Chloroflexota bacterium]
MVGIGTGVGSEIGEERAVALIEGLQAGRLTRRQFVRRMSAAGFAGGTIALLLAACGGSSPAGGSQSPAASNGGVPTFVSTAVPTAAAASSSVAGTLMKAPEANVKRGGTIRIATNVVTTSYDIHQGGSSTALCHAYNSLIRLNLVDGLKTIIPDVAESWQMSADGLTYTFKLRSGVLFHDGTPLTSDDVAATYNRIVAPPQGVVSIQRDFFSMVSKVETVDPMTAKFTLAIPSPIFLLLLTATFNVIYSKKTLDANNNDLRKVQIPPGTGPFTFVSYKENELWTFAKNPNYWNKDLPYLDSVEMLHVPAFSDRGTAVLTGRADYSPNVAKETWDEGQKHPDTIKGTLVAQFGCYQVVINTRKKPFDDPRVRRACFLALNRQGLFQAFATQEQIRLTRWVPYGSEFATPPEEIAKLPGYRADKAQDIADAKKLLADAGFPNGIQGVDFLVASLPPHAEVLGPAVQDQLKQALGVETKIRVQERAFLVEDEKKGNFTLVLDTPGGPIADVSPLANAYLKTGGSQNYGGYSNPKVDDLLKRSDAEQDRTKRADLLNQLQDALDQDPPWFFIGYTTQLPMWHTYVKGLALEQRIIQEVGRVDTAWLDK